MTSRHPVNPWTWQDARGFTQAWSVDGASRLLFVSGQGPLDADGRLVEGDFETQARRTFDNLAAVLGQAGTGFGDVVKLTVFLTDIAELPIYGRVKAEHIRGQQPASTAVEVSALAIPGMRLEVEAIAVQ